MEDLKAAKEEVEAEEDVPGQSSSSSSDSVRKSSSSGNMNGHMNGVMPDTNVILHDKYDEIVESPKALSPQETPDRPEEETSPVPREPDRPAQPAQTEPDRPVEEATQREPDRPVRDIRFGDLPHPRNDIRFGDLPQPRKHERENSDVTRANELAIDDSEDGIGRCTTTIENAQSQGGRDGTQPRLRRAGSQGGFPRSATFERVLNTAFRRRRDESPSSRRSTQTQMTLPYFTFNPTIGRNSLFLGLTEEQREELGGVEYRAVKVLLLVLVGMRLCLWGGLMGSLFLRTVVFELDLSCSVDYVGFGSWGDC